MGVVGAAVLPDRILRAVLLDNEMEGSRFTRNMLELASTFGTTPCDLRNHILRLGVRSYDFVTDTASEYAKTMATLGFVDLGMQTPRTVHISI
jgi:hypothetical protein